MQRQGTDEGNRHVPHNTDDCQRKGPIALFEVVSQGFAAQTTTLSSEIRQRALAAAIRGDLPEMVVFTATGSEYEH